MVVDGEVKHSEGLQPKDGVAPRENLPRSFLWRDARMSRDEDNVVALDERGHPDFCLDAMRRRPRRSGERRRGDARSRNLGNRHGTFWQN